MVQKGVIKLQYVAIDKQVADILTKPLPLKSFARFKGMLGVAENTSRWKGVLKIAASRVILQYGALSSHPVLAREFGESNKSCES